MSLFGVGPKIYSLPYIILLLAGGLRYRYGWGSFGIPGLRYVGAALCLLALPLLMKAALQLLPSLKAQELQKHGLYGWCRNPLYFLQFCLLMPGLSLLMDSFVGLISPLLAYMFFAVFIREEEEMLAEKFGSVYKEYCACTPRFWPTLPDKEKVDDDSGS